ncbi:MAG: TolC family protein, partial [Bradyrhizobium sp.]|nr:TolC family protein [Bradyrhizobium sp.]
MTKVARKPKSRTARQRGVICVAPVLAVLLLAPALSGCILGSERPELNLEVPAAYREASLRSADAAVPALDWWRGFRSKELTTLMENAQVFNLDIAVAVAQIVQADAQVGVSGSPLFPSVTGTATAERQKVSTATAGGGTVANVGVGGSTFSNYNLGLSASYMIDFWGKNRATLYAAEESATVARYNREVVTLTTLVTVANTYFQVLA